MIEDEAKTKFCCGPDGTGTPRVLRYNAETDSMEMVGHLRMCIGSACMAWRYTGETTYLRHIDREGGVTVRHGYCGLAGVGQ